MKKTCVFGIAFLLALQLSCKDQAVNSATAISGNAEQSSIASESLEAVDASKSPNEMTSSSAMVDTKSKRKFIKTADARFEVKNVAESTYIIENLATKLGGFVTKSNLSSSITETEESKISTDSTLVVSKYRVASEITLRVPNVKLDSLLRSISKTVIYLDNRNINSDEVTLQYLEHELSKKRSQKHQSRVGNAIASKSGGVDKVVAAQKELYNAEENADADLINHLSIDDEVNFSMVSLNLYQKERLKKEVVISVDSIKKMEPNIFYKIWQSIKQGWYLIEKIVVGLITIWPILLILSGLVFILRKKNRLQINKTS